MKHWSQKQGEKTKWGYTWLCGGRRQHTQRGGGRGSNSNGINSSSVGTRNRRMQGRRYVSACYLSRLSVHFLSIQLAIFSLSLPMIRWSLSNFCFPIYNVAAFSFFFYSACDVVVVEQPRRKLIVVGNKSSSPETFVSFSFFFSLSLFWRNSSQTQVLSLSVHNERSGAECGLCTHRAVYIGLVTTRPRFPGSLSGWRVVVGRRSIDCVFLSSLYCVCVRCVCVIWPSEPKRGGERRRRRKTRATESIWKRARCSCFSWCRITEKYTRAASLSTRAPNLHFSLCSLLTSSFPPPFNTKSIVFPWTDPSMWYTYFGPL